LFSVIHLGAVVRPTRLAGTIWSRLSSYIGIVASALDNLAKTKSR